MLYLQRMELTSDTLIARNNEILANGIGSETVMMSIEKGKYYGTNKTGSYIWQVLETPMTFGSLCARLASDFNIPEDRCREEVMPFIEEMQKENIIAIQ
jgi:hypothetical protein